MAMTYKERNLANIAELAPNTRYLAEKWHEYCEKNGIDILIYETIRTEEQQRKNVQEGKSKTMKSYHLVGQALDFVPVVNGKAKWDGYDLPQIKKAIAEAKRLGFEWGGDWEGAWDKPHLQFKYKGYGTDKELTVDKQFAKEAPKAAVKAAAKPATTAKKSPTSAKKAAAPALVLPNTYLRKGDKGEAVKVLQMALNALSFKCGAVDGVFGESTEDALIRFQKVYMPREVDGIYGPKTRAAMSAQLKK
jgi:peptidoglycan LD-endopeptidase CwlK